MFVPPSLAWRFVLAVVLACGILVSAYAHAPRKAVPGADLRRLVLSALSLYAVGALASLTGHTATAAMVYAVGILVCALAAWLSRGRDAEDPPDDDGDQPVDEQPPPEPDGLPNFDWTAFERDFRSFAERQRDPARA